MMLVDDDPCLLAGLTDMLRFRLPHVRVTPFELPCSALARFKTTEFDAVGKPFDRDEFVTAVTYALAAHKLSREVTARQLHWRRMTQRIAVLHARIQASQEKPITIPSIRQCIQTSRQLNQSSVVLMKPSLDRIQQQMILLEARLKETERPLLSAWQEAHRRAIYRFSE